MEKNAGEISNDSGTKKSFQDSVSKQFWKYLNDQQVLDAFGSGLTLLFQLPIKPANIQEFFAEFLENGAINLVKFSALQVELFYKKAELQQLHQEYPDLRREMGSFDEDDDSLTSISKSSKFDGQGGSVFSGLGMKSIHSASNPKSALNFLQIPNELSDIEFETWRRESTSGTSRIFKLEHENTGSIESKTKEEHGKSNVQLDQLQTSKNTSVDDKISSPELKESSTKEKKSSLDAANEKIKKSRQVIKAISKGKISGRKDEHGKKSELKNTGQGKSKSDQQKATKNESTCIEEKLLGPVKEKRILSLEEGKQYRQVSKIVAAIKNPIEKETMEHVLMTIADHKRMDPAGILFDFSRKNSVRQYELQLYEKGAPEKLLRKLSIVDSYDSIEPSLEKNDADLEDEGFNEDADASEVVSIGRNRRISISEAKKILSEQNHRRLIRDGLTLLHQFKTKQLKKLKESRKNKIQQKGVKKIESESDWDYLSEDEAEKISDQYIRMLHDGFRHCSKVDPSCPDFQASSNYRPILPEPPTIKGKPSIVVTDADEEFPSAEKSKELKENGSCKRIDLPIVPKVTRKQIRRILSKLYEKYHEHLEEVHVLMEHKDVSKRYRKSSRTYKEELEKRFQKNVHTSKEEALVAVSHWLIRTLNKARISRDKEFLRKRTKCRNIGYSRFEPFADTKKKERLHQSYSVTVPALPEKEYTDFLERFDSSNGTFNSEGLHTKTDFVYDFPLDEVKSTQRWIDKTFPEHIWKLNEPLEDPSIEIDSNDDDEENYVWAEDYDSSKLEDDQKLDFGNKAISEQEYRKIEKFLEEGCEEKQGIKVGIDQKDVQVVQESDLPRKFMVEQPTPSMESFFRKHASSVTRKRYSELKPSERSKQYVEKVYCPNSKDHLLKTFPFELLDED